MSALPHWPTHDRLLLKSCPSLAELCATVSAGRGSCCRSRWALPLPACLPARRLESQYAVTASNLFKYCHPAQGVVLFKHHDPLSFSLPQLSDLLNVSQSWFQAAAAAATGEEARGGVQHSHQQQCENGNSGSKDGSSSGASLGSSTELRQRQQEQHQEQHRQQQGQAGRRSQLHPLFIWNSLPRAGWWLMEWFCTPSCMLCTIVRCLKLDIRGTLCSCGTGLIMCSL